MAETNTSLIKLKPKLPPLLDHVSLNQDTGESALFEAKGRGNNDHERDILDKSVNQILTFHNHGELTYFIPAYLRITVNRVSQIDYFGCRATLDLTIRLWVMAEGLPEHVKEEIVEECELRVNGDLQYRLKEIREKKKNNHMINNASEKVMAFSVRKVVDLEIDSDVWLSPFELIKIRGAIEMVGSSSFDRLEEGVKKRNIEFNFMECHPFVQFSFNELRNLGNFDLAESLVGINFSNEKYFGKMKFSVSDQGNLIEELIMPFNLFSRKEESMQQVCEPVAYSHGQISLSLYKYPFSAVFSIFVPFYLLTIVSFGIFFQANDMNGRAISISMLLMSFFSFLPSIRSRLPAVPSIILTELLIYLQTLSMMLYFVQSLWVKDIEGYEFVWHKDPFFLAIMIISLINFFSLVVISVMHKFVWEPSYNKLPQGTQEISKKPTFNTDLWHNIKCQTEFEPMINTGCLKVLTPKYISRQEDREIRLREKRESKLIVLKAVDSAAT